MEVNHVTRIGIASLAAALIAISPPGLGQAQQESRPAYATTKVDGIDNVYMFGERIAAIAPKLFQTRHRIKRW